MEGVRQLSYLCSVPFLAVILISSVLHTHGSACGIGYLPEDINRDGEVDMIDLLVAAKAFGSYPGHNRWNQSADINRDGKINMIDLGRIARMFGVELAPLSLVVDVRPNTLNLASRGRWITVHIAFSSNCSINEVDVSGIKLNDTIPAEARPFNIENNTLMVKFSRPAVQSYILNLTHFNISKAEVSLTVTGKFCDGTEFIGTDSIKVITRAF